MITEENLIQSIKEFSTHADEYYESSNRLEDEIKEYLEEAPSKVTVFDEYIRIQIPSRDFTNVVMDKINRLQFKLHDGDILLPIPRKQE